MSDTPVEVATCQVIEGVTSVNAQIDLVVVAGVEVEVPSGTFIEGEHIVLVEGLNTEILPASVLPNPPVGEMLIQHEGMDVSNLVLPL